jgi:hypothetical protein
MKFQEVFNPLISSLNATVTSINKAAGKPQYDALMKVYDSTRAVIQTRIDEFVALKTKICSDTLRAFLLLLICMTTQCCLKKDTMQWTP